MATKLMHPCRHPGCTVLTQDKYCKAHARAHNEEYFARLREHRSSDAWAWMYSTAEWKRRRADQLRHHPWCQVPGCHERATEVDHVEAHRGDWQAFINGKLQSLCKRHHVQKTMREVADRRKSAGT